MPFTPIFIIISTGLVSRSLSIKHLALAAAFRISISKPYIMSIDTSAVGDDERTSSQVVSPDQDEVTEAVPSSADSSSENEAEAIVPRPKRPLSAYNMFFRDQREMLLKTLPRRQSDTTIGRGHGKIGFQDLARVIGAKWREIDPQEKERYEKVAAEGRAKYLEQAKAWKEQQKKHGLPLTKPKKKKVSRKVSSSSETVAQNASIVQQQEVRPFMWAGSSLISQNPGSGRRALSLPSYGRVPGSSVPSSYNEFMGNQGTPAMIGMNMTQPMAASVFSGSNGPYAAFAGQREDSLVVDTLSDELVPGRLDTNDLLDFEPIPTNLGFGSLGAGEFPECPSSMDQGVPAETESLLQTFDRDFEDPISYNTEFSNTRNVSHHHMNRLAGRMGQDCVDLFVGMFGSSRQT